jgi:hypothetical protein
MGIVESSPSCTRAGNDSVIDSGILVANMVIST